ncbi:hypothetical protein MBEHAL_2626 [Halarchaeum acidiphilum MH1-52-1]|uniref:Transcriptional regulator n=1 Tax=Halarchaeum acidiphilum MH1-52-1 TaxID=1261545 RepID=U2YHC8_9EURY|nr:hypothetical protein [Halarchaeum acidiphilum]GAD53866.1 hypothetical protein MBEHAL_2626 [Halarchaeum acidiphilum MH1-52-1]
MNGDTPPDLDLTGEWDATLENRTVKDRVYEVATTLTSATSVTEIAERADCTKEGARPHLEWFVDLGVLEKVADNPALFVRNEAYFEFRRVTELTREFETADEVAATIEEYRDRERELAASFEASSPSAVVLADIEYNDLDEAYDRLSEWRAATRRLRELHEAKLRLESGSESASASSFP